MTNEQQATAEYQAMPPLRKLAVARAAACEAMPYLRAALLALVPHEYPGLGTLGVTKTMVLLWDGAALARWSKEETTVIVLHEIWHILRDHADRAEAAQAHPRIWNIAADAEINDDLEAAFPGMIRQAHGVLPEDFGAAAGGIAEGYYAMLRAQAAAAMAGAGAGSSGSSGLDSGQCGSGAGHAIAGEPDTGDGSGTGDSGGGAAESLLGRTAAEIESVQRRVAEAVREEARKSRGRGSVPGGWLRWADAALKPPKVRWQDKLARAMRAGVAYRRGAADWTYGKVSRRQAGIGFGPGRPVLHSTHSPVPRVDVWVDTSGSMGEVELTAALRESRGILQSGATVRFGAIDAAVQTAKIVRDWRELPALLKGGGGTDFRPAFDASIAARRGTDETLVVFITDGDGEAPAVQPRGIRTIWLLVGNHRRRPCEWGQMIEVDE